LFQMLSANVRDIWKRCKELSNTNLFTVLINLVFELY